MSKKIIISLVLVLGLAAANAWEHWLKPKPMAPELTMATLQGETFNIAEQKGKPVLVTFWQTKCGLCLEEIDDLIAMEKQYKAQGYRSVAIAMTYDSLPDVKKMIKEWPLPFPVVFDEKGDYAKAFGGVRLTPTHFLIDPAGRIIWDNLGPIEREELQALITPLLPNV